MEQRPCGLIIVVKIAMLDVKTIYWIILIAYLLKLSNYTFHFPICSSGKGWGKNWNDSIDAIPAPVRPLCYLRARKTWSHLDLLHALQPSAPGPEGGDSLLEQLLFPPDCLRDRHGEYGSHPHLCLQLRDVLGLHPQDPLLRTVPHRSRSTTP
jgi:hypothetical protein